VSEQQQAQVIGSSRPYPWPYHGRFEPSGAALLLFTGDVDAVPEREVVSRLHSLIAEARSSGVAVIALPAAGGGTPVTDVAGCDAVVVRPRLGGFTGTGLALVLRNLGRTDLLIAGFPFELGADCTMRQANDLGYECVMVEDCCSAVSPETFAGAVSSIQMSGGIFGTVASSEDVLELLRGGGASPA
jgi:nicotinamidase-related amidase